MRAGTEGSGSGTKGSISGTVGSAAVGRLAIDCIGLGNERTDRLLTKAW